MRQIVILSLRVFQWNTSWQWQCDKRKADMEFPYTWDNIWCSTLEENASLKNVLPRKQHVILSRIRSKFSGLVEQDFRSYPDRNKRETQHVYFPCACGQRFSNRKLSSCHPTFALQNPTGLAATSTPTALLGIVSGRRPDDGAGTNRTT